MIDKKVKSFAIAALRRASFKWPPRYKAANKSKVARGLYQCNICKKEVRAKDKELDHVTPVVDPILGWQGFDSYIERLYCEEEGFQTLCPDCHHIKTGKEQSVRVKGKPSKRKKIKND